MNAILIAAMFLFAWWIAQTLLSLRDYLVTRHKNRRLPPPTEEEKLAVARCLAARPHKEKKTRSWYLLESVKRGWLYFPVLLLFWPIALLYSALPPLETRLPQDAVGRINAGELEKFIEQAKAHDHRS